jgi:hypothetical protein
VLLSLSDGRPIRAVELNLFPKLVSISSTDNTRFLDVLLGVLNGRSALPRDYQRELIEKLCKLGFVK